MKRNKVSCLNAYREVHYYASGGTKYQKLLSVRLTEWGYLCKSIHGTKKSQNYRTTKRNTLCKNL